MVNLTSKENSWEGGSARICICLCTIWCLVSGAQSGGWFTSCLAEEFIWVGERICIFQYMIVAAVVVIIGEFIKVGGREEFVFDAIVALFNPIQCSCTIHSMIVAILPDLPVWCHLYVPEILLSTDHT